MSDELPPWPDDFGDLTTEQWLDVEIARSEAAVARLRVAVEALGYIARSTPLDAEYDENILAAKAALRRIGPLPWDQ